MKQKVKCKICGVIRQLHRKKNTPPEYSFRCFRCDKEVAQDLDFRKQQDKLTP